MKQCWSIQAFCLRIGLILISYVCGVVQAKDTEVRLYNAGWTPELRSYYSKVLIAALDATQSEYGAYTLTKYNHFLSSARLMVETQRGKSINLRITTLAHCSRRADVYIAKGRYQRKEYSQDIICIRFPALKGLLGFRQLLIHRDSLQAFSQIRQTGPFRSFSAGFAKSWEEVSLFKKQNLPVTEVVKAERLLSMLTKKRFDYIPLSVLEMHNWFDDQSELAIADNIFMYYPIPIYLMVSSEQPELAERLDKGLKMIEASSVGQTLFDNEFSKTLSKLSIYKNATLMVVHSPFLNGQENTAYYESFMKAKHIDPLFILPLQKEDIN